MPPRRASASTYGTRRGSTDSTPRNRRGSTGSRTKTLTSLPSLPTSQHELASRVDTRKVIFSKIRKALNDWFDSDSSSKLQRIVQASRKAVHEVILEEHVSDLFKGVLAARPRASFAPEAPEVSDVENEAAELGLGMEEPHVDTPSLLDEMEALQAELQKLSSSTTSDAVESAMAIVLTRVSQLRALCNNAQSNLRTLEGLEASFDSQLSHMGTLLEKVTAHLLRFAKTHAGTAKESLSTSTGHRHNVWFPVVDHCLAELGVFQETMKESISSMSTSARTEDATMFWRQLVGDRVSIGDELRRTGSLGRSRGSRSSQRGEGILRRGPRGDVVGRTVDGSDAESGFGSDSDGSTTPRKSNEWILGSFRGQSDVQVPQALENYVYERKSLEPVTLSAVSRKQSLEPVMLFAASQRGSLVSQRESLKLTRASAISSCENTFAPALLTAQRSSLKSALEKRSSASFLEADVLSRVRSSMRDSISTDMEGFRSVRSSLIQDARNSILNSEVTQGTRSSVSNNVKASDPREDPHSREYHVEWDPAVARSGLALEESWAWLQRGRRPGSHCDGPYCPHCLDRFSTYGLSEEERIVLANVLAEEGIEANSPRKFVGLSPTRTPVRSFHRSQPKVVPDMLKQHPKIVSEIVRPATSPAQPSPNLLNGHRNLINAPRHATTFSGASEVELQAASPKAQNLRRVPIVGLPGLVGRPRRGRARNCNSGRLASTWQETVCR